MNKITFYDDNLKIESTKKEYQYNTLSTNQLYEILIYLEDNKDAKINLESKKPLAIKLFNMFKSEFDSDEIDDIVNKL